jgi:hypothetical protein
MKHITLGFVMIIAFVFSVIPRTSPPAQAFTLIDPVTFVCEDTVSDQCTCEDGVVVILLSPLLVFNNLKTFRTCCNECGGTIVHVTPEF